MRTSQQAICAGLVLAVLLTLAGCNGAGAKGSDPRAARLCEDEMYRMGEQVKTMQKQMEADKATAAAAAKEKAETEKGCTDTVNLFMDQMKEKDAQIEKLNQRIAELEKGQTPPTAK
jgi:hypothetical protein